MLRSALAAVRKRNASVVRRLLVALAVVVLPLWVATMLATKRILIPTVFWMATGAVISVWNGRDLRKGWRKQQLALEDALATNRVDEIRIAATEMFELEEIGDLGACYAFQAEEDKILIVQGQDYDATRRFPSTDFSIATILDSAGEPVEIAVHKRGKKLKPSRMISEKAQKTMRLPTNLEVLNGRLSELEDLLRLPRSR